MEPMQTYPIANVRSFETSQAVNASVFVVMEPFSAPGSEARRDSKVFYDPSMGDDMDQADREAFVFARARAG